MEIQDCNTLAPKHKADVKEFVLNHEGFGLTYLDGYGVELFDVFLGSPFRLPRTEHAEDVSVLPDRVGLFL